MPSTSPSPVPTFRFRADTALVTLMALSAIGVPAHARQSQSGSPPASGGQAGTSAGTQSGDIVVTGRTPTTITSIDRKSYSLSNDLQARTGSAADALRNLPSVTVDVDGNPSLRGDANVQILIDGRPAPEFNNANRGAALEQLGADNIVRVEVLTNPPANFKPDGSAGIINIITRRRSKRRTASIQANAGTGGRFNLSGTGSTQVGRLNLHATVSLRHDIRTRTVADDKTQIDATTGAFQSATSIRSTGTSDRLSESATLGGDMDLSKADHLSAEGSYINRFDHAAYGETDFRFDPAGATIGRYLRHRPGTERQQSNSAMLRYQHDLGQDGSGITVLAQRSQTSEDQRLRYADTFDLPPSAPLFQRQTLVFDEVTRELAIDYTQMLPGKSKFLAGYNLQRDENVFDNIQTFAVPAGGMQSPDPGFTNAFRFGQTVQAWYGSYERPIGSLTVLAGVRMEQTNIQTYQVTSSQRGHQSYFRVYPNLHLAKKLTDHQTLSLSYGVRVIRPEADDLNPYLVQRDAFTLRRGNPGLMPQEIQSLEAGWSYEKGSTSRSATLYYRRFRNSFTIVTTPIDASTVLITEANLGRSQSGGLELAASGGLLPRLTYSLSGNVLYSQIDASNLGYAKQRSAISYDVKGALDWSLDAKDAVQINAASVGQRLTPQGHRRGYTTLDLGYQRKLAANLSLTATLSDVFASRREGMIIDAAGLSEVVSRRMAGRVVLFGLSWNLPGAKKKDDAFQYDR